MTISATSSPAGTRLHELIDLTGQTAVVTGGAMGIGEGIARRLHEAGANIVVADIDHAAHEFAQSLNAIRADSSAGFELDVSDERAVDAMVSAALTHFDGIDVLVNNAGIYPSVPFTEMDADTFRRVIDVNLVGVFLCTKAVATRMIERGRGGRIINVTSIDAVHPSMVGLAHYDASKHGVWGFTKNIALELAAHRIWVNALAPGGITTPGIGGMPSDLIEAFEAVIPMHRMGHVDDIARAALFLASDLSSYMTGSQLVVDGGKLLT
jgi:2-dehydro-3-deoxy-D-gluconate 5-dehydrogenase